MVTVLMSTMFGSAQASLLALPSERPVFLREYSTDHYSVLPYFLARLSVEAVLTFSQILVQNLVCYFLIDLQMGFMLFLAISYALALANMSVGVLIGSWVEDPKLASELMPVLIVPQLLFAGFFVSTDAIPAFLRWAQYLCSLVYAVRLSLDAEFGDCEAPSCIALIESNEVNSENTWWYWLALWGIFVGFRTTAVLVLRKKATKFF